MVEFWNELITRKSWEKLQELTKQFDLVIIGGWAVYLWTKAHKSKDIDAIVDYNTLEKLKMSFQVERNEQLKKYEVKFEQFDLDIYVPHFSKLGIPPEELLKKYTTTTSGIKTITPEALLILKQSAEISRTKSVKGRKDAIDILCLLIYSGVDLKEYHKILKETNKLHLARELARVIKEFGLKDAAYVGKNFKQLTEWKREMLKEIK